MTSLLTAGLLMGAIGVVIAGITLISVRQLKIIGSDAWVARERERIAIELDNLERAKAELSEARARLKAAARGESAPSDMSKGA